MGDVVIDLDKLHEEVYGGRNGEEDLLFGVMSEFENGIYHIRVTHVDKNYNYSQALPKIDWGQYDVSDSDTIVIRKSGKEYSFSMEEVISASIPNGVYISQIIGGLINSIDNGETAATPEQVAKVTAREEIVDFLDEFSDKETSLNDLQLRLAAIEKIPDHEKESRQEFVEASIEKEIKGVKYYLDHTNSQLYMRKEFNEFFISRGVDTELAGHLADYILSEINSAPSQKELDWLSEYASNSKDDGANFNVAMFALHELITDLSDKNMYADNLHDAQTGLGEIILEKLPERGMKPNKGGQSLA